MLLLCAHSQTGEYIGSAIGTSLPALKNASTLDDPPIIIAGVFALVEVHGAQQSTAKSPHIGHVDPVSTKNDRVPWMDKPIIDSECVNGGGRRESLINI